MKDIIQKRLGKIMNIPDNHVFGGHYPAIFAQGTLYVPTTLTDEELAKADRKSIYGRCGKVVSSLTGIPVDQLAVGTIESGECEGEDYVNFRVKQFQSNLFMSHDRIVFVQG